MRIAVAEEIPGRTCPLGHGIGLSLGCAAALGAGAVDEGIDPGQRGLTVLAGLEVFHLGKAQRQFFIGNRYDAAFRTMNERDRLAPVSLTVEGPVLHLVLDAGFADALLFDLLAHAGDGILLVGIAVEIFGVDHLSVAGIGFLLDIAALDDLDDINAEFLCKFPVTLVVGGNGHDGTGTVAHHDIVSHEDGNFFACHRVDGLHAFDLKTCLFLDQLGPFKLGLFGAGFAVFIDLIHICDAVGILVDQRMLGSHDHEGHAEEGIGPGGIDPDLLIGICDGEVYESACGTADPVDLLELDVFGIVHIVEAVKELVRIFGNAQIPYVLGKLDDIAVADVALAALGVFIGQDYLAVRAVIDQCGITEHETVLEELKEDPLCPLIVFGICGIDGPVIVKGETDALQLSCEFLDINVCDHTGMGIGLDRIVLCGQTESIESDGHQDVIALHSSLSGDDFNAGISLDVAYVHACSRRIGEFHQSVELGLFGEIHGLEDAGIRPLLLPLGLDLLKIVIHNRAPFIIKLIF